MFIKLVSNCLGARGDCITAYGKGEGISITQEESGMYFYTDFGYAEGMAWESPAYLK